MDKLGGIELERLSQTTQLKLLIVETVNLNSRKEEFLKIGDKLNDPSKEGRDARFKAIKYTINKETKDILVDICDRYDQELNCKKPHKGMLKMLRMQLRQVFYIIAAEYFQTFGKLVKKKLFEKFGDDSTMKDKRFKRLFEIIY